MTDSVRTTDELDDYRGVLKAIRDRLPTCSEESADAWTQRVWNGEFRDLQRCAREVLRKHGH